MQTNRFELIIDVFAESLKNEQQKELLSNLKKNEKWHPEDLDYESSDFSTEIFKEKLSGYLQTEKYKNKETIHEIYEILMA